MNNGAMCAQNANLLTNFSKDIRKVYELVVELWGDDIFITDDAYWMNGHLDPNLCALRAKDIANIDTNKLYGLIHDIKSQFGYTNN